MWINRLKEVRVILASQSPRRKELLASLDIPFEVEVKSVDETVPSGIRSDEVAEHLALKKLHVYADDPSYQDAIVITADTVVVDHLNNVLGKPVSAQEAFEVVWNLSANQHFVYTGVAIGYKGEIISFTDKTKVNFETLSEEEIHYYVNNYKPFDKAGSYGIQEWIGRVAISSIEGSYENVMGLPTVKVYRALKKLINK